MNQTQKLKEKEFAKEKPISAEDFGDKLEDLVKLVEDYYDIYGLNRRQKLNNVHKLRKLVQGGFEIDYKKIQFLAAGLINKNSKTGVKRLYNLEIHNHLDEILYFMETAEPDVGITHCQNLSEKIEFIDRKYKQSKLKKQPKSKKIMMDPNNPALQIVNSIKKSKLYRSVDGLVAYYMNSSGNLSDCNIYPSPNTLFGMLLHIVGDSQGAKQVVNSLKNSDLYRPADGLVARCMDSTRNLLDSDVYPSPNALFGMLLYAVGDKEGAEKVVNSITNSNLYRPADGLVVSFMNSSGNLWGNDVYSNHNALFGMLSDALYNNTKTIFG